MNIISMSCFVVFFIAFLLPYQILSNEDQIPSASNDLIRRACETSRYKDLCITSLRSHNETKGADLQGVGKVALKIAKTNGKEIYQYISKLQNKTAEPFLQQCLTDCSEDFREAISVIEESEAAVDVKSYNDVNKWISAAMSYEESCEDGFQEKPGYQSPLTRMNTIFTQLCSVSLSINSLLAGNGTKL